MKLKNILVLAFLTLTLIPIVIVSFLLYKSGFDLSKEAYTRNLAESINVQADYISQTIENNMISDYRFAHRSEVINALSSGTANTTSIQNSNLLTALQSYLEASEDKISVFMLMDKYNTPIYKIGEKTVSEKIHRQLTNISNLSNQKLSEFELEQGVYSLGVITPIYNNNQFIGSLISVYDKSYIFKVISSYYKVTDTFTYICRHSGDIINVHSPKPNSQSQLVTQTISGLSLSAEGVIDKLIDHQPILGYYKNIHNSPWYLVGFIDYQLIYAFTNQFLWIYILIIIVVLLADVALAFYFSRKVVEPINNLIDLMDKYKSNLYNQELPIADIKGYFETNYLRDTFISLMKTITLVQHNFKGIYHLYQSSDMDDTNIDIDVKNQTISSNKQIFQELMDSLDLPPSACIIERFINCFSEKDKAVLMHMFLEMRNEHLSVTKEAEVYTPHLNQKWFHTLVVPMYEDDSLSRLFIQLRDISNFKKQEFISIEQARRDVLTELYNRSGFSECVQNILYAPNNSIKSDLHCLLFIDMNFFKMVNDTFGHKAGDDLLRTIANDLTALIGIGNIASRFGGDEFAIFLPHTSSEYIDFIKNAINTKLIYPFTAPDMSFVVSASIGIATCSHSHPATLDTLLQQADAAMYKTKRELKEHSK